MPFLSVIVPTYRVGGIDILLNALANQSFGDFEVVLVDMLYRHRADRVAEYARDRFVRLLHVEPDPNNFPVASFCACVNTGLRVSSGKVILHMVDFSSPAPDVLERHAKFHLNHIDHRSGLMGPHRYVAIEGVEIPRYSANEWKEYEEDVESGALSDFMLSIGHATALPDSGHIVDGGARAAFDADPKLRMPPGLIKSDFFHLKNESYKRSQQQLLDISFDGAHGYQDSDLADRLDVTWTLDPTCIVDIANPRGVLPMLRRDRDIRENEHFLARKRHDRKSTIRPFAASTEKKLSIAMVYGEFSSAIHGPFDFSNLHNAALTGSESSFFNTAKTLAERGHKVVVLAPAVGPYDHPSGTHMLPLEAIRGLPQLALDVVIAWNEPDYLQFAPAGSLRIVDQQLNDWGYCRYPNWQNLVDLFVFPSYSSQLNHRPQLQGNPTVSVIPNSVDLALFSHGGERHPHRVIYCSSPDRGLHHLLAIWPTVRAKIPGAELKIFYRLEPWLIRARDADDEVGRRARYIEEALRRLTRHGVEVVGPVPNAEMARQLQAATVLAYPCDPVRYTEGFGCSVLDAAAAGCLPVISDADALAEVHGKASVVISGPINHDKWTRQLLQLLESAEQPTRPAMRDHVTKHSRQEIGVQWEQALFKALKLQDNKNV